MSFHIGNFANFAGHPPKNQIYIFVITSLTTTQFEYGLAFLWNQKDQAHHLKNKVLGGNEKKLPEDSSDSMKKKVNLRYLP